MKYVLPDYENCGLNVIASIMKHFGVPGHKKTHPVMDRILEKKYSKVVFMLFDGMGMDVLERYLDESDFLRSHNRHVMKAVYPSTTTNVTSSYETGLYPKEHAWLGWTLYFDEIEKPVDIFINKSNGEEAAEYDVAWRYIPKESLFDKVTEAGVEACSVSAFTDEYYAETTEDLFAITKELCEKEGRRYIYTYWNEPDHHMHGHGCHVEELGDILKEISARTEKLVSQIPDDTLVILTADHGLIDAKHHYLDDHPRIADMLRHVPTVEARAASFHVKKESLADFPRVFREEYGENFLLLSRDEFIDQFLGEGEEHPKLRDFVGDYMALSTDRDCIDKYRSDFELKGVHAGLTPQEMLVPLIIAKA